MDQHMPLSQGAVGIGGLDRQPDKQQPQMGNKNMTEIYDMLEKYQSQDKPENR